MKHLLAGNGINIQFDNENYTTQQILLRILKNCDKPDFPTHVIVQPSYLMKNFYGLLYLEARKLIAGEYDGYTHVLLSLRLCNPLRNNTGRSSQLSVLLISARKTII